MLPFQSSPLCVYPCQRATVVSPNDSLLSPCPFLRNANFAHIFLAAINDSVLKVTCRSINNVVNSQISLETALHPIEHLKRIVILFFSYSKVQYISVSTYRPNSASSIFRAEVFKRDNTTLVDLRQSGSNNGPHCINTVEYLSPYSHLYSSTIGLRLFVRISSLEFIQA